uniref:Chlorophyllase n=1 Tax=Picocystis salinarum TaxID=88271 RepID=A0A7S3UDH9_9CHLO
MARRRTKHACLAVGVLLWTNLCHVEGFFGRFRRDDDVVDPPVDGTANAMDFSLADERYQQMHEKYEAEAASMATDAQGFQFDRTGETNQARRDAVRIRNTGQAPSVVEPTPTSSEDMAVAQEVEREPEENDAMGIDLGRLPDVMPAADGDLAIANGNFGQCMRMLPELQRRCNVPDPEDIDQVQAMDTSGLRDGPGEECCAALTLFVDELECFCYPAVSNTGEDVLQVVKNVRRFCEWEETQYEDNPKCKDIVMDADIEERKQLDRMEEELLSFGKYKVGSTASKFTLSADASPTGKSYSLDILVHYPSGTLSDQSGVQDELVFPIVLLIPEYEEKPSAYQITMKSLASQGHYVVAADWIQGKAENIFSTADFHEAAEIVQTALKQVGERSGIFGSGTFERVDTKRAGLVGHGKGALLASLVVSMQEEPHVPIKSLAALSPVCDRDVVDQMEVSDLRSAQPVSVNDASCRAKLIGMGAACASDPGSQRCCTLFKDFNDNHCFCSETALQLGGSLLDLAQMQGGGFCDVEIVGRDSRQCNPQARADQLEEQQNWSKVCSDVLTSLEGIGSAPPTLVVYTTSSEIAKKEMAVLLNERLEGQLVELTNGTHCFTEVSSLYWPGSNECGRGSLAVTEQLNEARALVSQLLTSNMPADSSHPGAKEVEGAMEEEGVVEENEEEADDQGPDTRNPVPPETSDQEAREVPSEETQNQNVDDQNATQFDGPAVLMLACGGGDSMELIVTRGSPNSQVVILRGTSTDGEPGPLPDSITKCQGHTTTIVDAAQKRLGGMIRVVQTDHNGLARATWSHYKNPERCTMFVYQALDLSTCQLGPPLDTNALFRAQS